MKRSSQGRFINSSRGARVPWNSSSKNLQECFQETAPSPCAAKLTDDAWLLPVEQFEEKVELVGDVAGVIFVVLALFDARGRTVPVAAGCARYPTPFSDRPGREGRAPRGCRSCRRPRECNRSFRSWTAPAAANQLRKRGKSSRASRPCPREFNNSRRAVFTQKINPPNRHFLPPAQTLRGMNTNVRRNYRGLTPIIKAGNVSIVRRQISARNEGRSTIFASFAH